MYLKWKLKSFRRLWCGERSENYYFLKIWLGFLVGKAAVPSPFTITLSILPLFLFSLSLPPLPYSPSFSLVCIPLSLLPQSRNNTQYTSHDLMHSIWTTGTPTHNKYRSVILLILYEITLLPATKIFMELPTLSVRESSLMVVKTHTTVTVAALPVDRTAFVHLFFCLFFLFFTLIIILFLFLFSSFLFFLLFNFLFSSSFMSDYFCLSFSCSDRLRLALFSP